MGAGRARRSPSRVTWDDAIDARCSREGRVLLAAAAGALRDRRLLARCSCPRSQRLIDVVVVRRGRHAPARADVALYHVGNDPEAHGWIVDALRRRPGVVVLHDFVLHHLVAGLTLGAQGRARLPRRDGARRAASPAGCSRTACSTTACRRSGRRGRRSSRSPARCSAGATGLIVHSRYVEERAREAGYDGPIWRIPHPAWPLPGGRAGATSTGGPLFGCFGHMNASKRMPQLLEAFARVRAAPPGRRLLLVGRARAAVTTDRRLGSAARASCARTTWTRQRLWSLMAACDALVSLRAPTMGETSGTAIRALSLGKPLVVSDLGWFAELPDEVALKVPVDERRGRRARRRARAAAARAERRAAMGARRARYAEREHELDRVAERVRGRARGGGGRRRRCATRSLARGRARRPPRSGSSRHDAPRSSPAGSRGRPWRLDGDRRARTAGVARARARRPGLGVARRARRRLRRRPLPARAPDRRAVDHGRRADLLRAREELRRRRPLPRPRTCDPALRRRLPGADRPACALFALRARRATRPRRRSGRSLMSLAAVPAYFLARRVAPAAARSRPPRSPSRSRRSLYTGTLMTENAFYPLFLLRRARARARARATDTEAPARAARGCASLAFLTRSQAVALVPAVADRAAPARVARARRALRALRVRRSTRPLAGVVLGVLAVELARGRSPLDAARRLQRHGPASTTGSAGRQWLLYHVAELELVRRGRPVRRAARS